MSGRAVGGSSVSTDLADVAPPRRPPAVALAFGWVALVLALVPFGLLLATKFEHMFSRPYPVLLYAVLVLLVVVVNRCVARGAVVPAIALTGFLIVGGLTVFGFFTWPAIAALAVEVAIAASRLRLSAPPLGSRPA